MNNETKAQLQAISDNVLNLNYGSVAKFKNQIQGL